MPTPKTYEQLQEDAKGDTLYNLTTERLWEKLASRKLDVSTVGL